METRTIGKSGIKVAPLAFGGNVFGWTIDQNTSFTLLDAFTDAGFNLIDTADVYSNWVPGNQGGESEAIIGNWLKQSGKRDKVIIATKVGGEMSLGKKGLSKAHIRQSVEESLQRLQTNYIDLYQSHYDDPATPMEESLETYGELIKEGKIRAIGASNFSPERLREALQLSEQNGYPRYESLQPEYNLYERSLFEKELEPICLENTIGVINYFALASGFLTGKYRSEADLAKSKRGQGNKKYLNERGYRILSVLDNLAEQYTTDQASIAIAWLIAQPSITAPIASATNLDQLQSLVKAATLHLDPEAIELLNKASAE
ncbi:aldo/keto reductase [Adhaeribacter radiodurans]|uniref:Aldo/keto reductase n=1 Tax=Adhaeribacter radiodurans TaxID=2745197 RepID=A0A7L7L3D4_9BACT|nr:aldo/keto reductase [Adhaeribacter radiodurans]QMU27311.1 aldo/keto reductase [Adhaeribacter radiodurans]